MIIIAAGVGLLLPALNGWLLVRLLEGKTPVLLTLERWTTGFLAGLTGTMTLTYLLSAATGLPFTVTGFLSVQLPLLLALSLLLLKRLHSTSWRSPAPVLPPSFLRPPALNPPSCLPPRDCPVGSRPSCSSWDCGRPRRPAREPCSW